MKRFLLLVSFVFIALVGFGQLAVGDIAFIQYNSDGTDNFAFVTLVDIPGGEVIKFTDNEEDEIGGGEGTITWTAPVAGVPCGTIITIDTDPTASVGSVFESNDLNFSGANGDGIIAYQGADSSPNFITALGNENLTGGVYSGSNEGNLPAGLTLGVNAQSIVEIDNSKYDGPLFNDTKANLLASIYDFSNWVGSNSITQTFVGTFNVTSCSTLPTITTSIPSVPLLDYAEGAGPSTFEPFSVTATNFTPLSDLTLTVPSTTPQQFEISESSTGPYFTTLVLPVNATGTQTFNIYTRLAAGLSAGTYSGDITITGGPGASPATVGLTGEVTQPEINFSIASASVSETGTDYLIEVESSPAGNHDIDVVIVTGGSATNGTEYTYSTVQTLNFTGVTSQTLLIPINDNSDCAGDKNVIFGLANPVNCMIGAVNQLDLLITDDESFDSDLAIQDFDGTAPVWGTGGGLDGPAFGNTGNGREITTTQFFDLATVSIPAGATAMISVKTKAIDIENNDQLEFYVDLDGAGFPSQPDLIIQEMDPNSGSIQNGWDYSATGVATTIAGTGTVTFNGDGPTGYATVEISIPSGTSTVALRIASNNNNNPEKYHIDDIVLTASGCSSCFEPTVSSVFSLSSPTFVDTSSATVGWNLGGGGDNKLVLMRAGSPVGSNPQDNFTYVANSVFGLGDQVGSNDYVVYNGNGTQVNVTNLNPGTEYHTEIFDYNCIPGQENYLTTTTNTDAFVTKPVVVDDLSTLCVTDNSIEFSWNAPLSGNASGYLLVARQGAVPGGVTALDPSSALGDNLNFTSAATYASDSRILYNGIGTGPGTGAGGNVTVTGLTEGQAYTFILYSYAVGTTEYRYSDITSTTKTISQMDVPTYGGFAGDTEVTVNWTLPPTGCWDEIVVVADLILGINFMPSGDGSSYNANAVYGSGDVANSGYIVYKGVGTSVTITNLVNNQAKNIEIFVRNGTQWSQGVHFNLTPSAATVLEQGDLAIVSVNTNIVSGEDEVCFIAFKTIQESTAIDFTDNGYERVMPDLWGGAEGTVRIQRTGGGPIAAGTPICFQGQGNGEINSSTPGVEDFEIYNCGVNETANWTISSLNGNEQFNLNVNDQVWIMQGGAWTGGNGNHDGFYSGNVLYGWTATGWIPNAGYSNNIGSTLFPGSKCFTTDLNGIPDEDKVKYTGSMTTTSQLGWITRINDSANWTGYSSNGDYDANGPDYSGSCVMFPINTSTISEGLWTGAIDDQWFECGNWSDLRVPTDSVDVEIPASTPTAVIDITHPDAYLVGDVASIRDLEIVDGTVEVLSDSDLLKVNGALYIDGTGTLFNQNGGNIEAHKSIEIFGDGTLNMNSTGTMSTLTLHRHWQNFNLGTPPNDGFIENNSLVVFAGASFSQELENVNGLETFHNVTLSKGSNSTVELLGSDMAINNVLTFGTGGFIDAYSDFGTKVIMNSTNQNAIVGYEPFVTDGVYSFNDKYIQGTLERNVSVGTAYDFPIGARPSALNYHPLNLNITGGSGYVSAYFQPIDSDGQRREMNYFDNLNECDGVPTIVSYHEFSNLGYWNMEGTNPTMAYTVTLHPNANTNDPIPATDPTTGAYKVIKANSGTGGGTSATGPTWPYDQSQNTGPCVTTPNYYAAEESFIGFSDFAIIASVPPSVVNPIELISFEAKTQDRDIVLNWVTATEINNDLFNLYHSVDGVHWENIHTRYGAGNSVETLYYSFVHSKPTWGVHYYQLEQIDFDGTNTFSGIVAAEIGFESDITLYPIPADDVLYIDASYVFDAKLIEIHNDQGQVMSAWTFDNGKIDIQGLSNGIYFIRFTSLDQQVVKKFIKSSGR